MTQQEVTDMLKEMDELVHTLKLHIAALYRDNQNQQVT